MPDATTFSALFGAVFPTPAQVLANVPFGPTGADFTGTATLAEPTIPTGTPRHITLANRTFARTMVSRAEIVTITRGGVTDTTRAIRGQSLYTEPAAEGAETTIRRTDWLFIRTEYTISGAPTVPLPGDIITASGKAFVATADNDPLAIEPIDPGLLQLRVPTRPKP